MGVPSHFGYRIVGFVLTICIGLFSGVGLVQAESVEEFVAEYTILEDGTVHVTERITYDFADNERRGIERHLDDSHVQSATAWYKTRYVTISDITARMVDDSSLSHELRGRDGYTVRIAYEDPSVSGIHTYEISYNLRGALSYDEQAAELYWNVTGSDWTVPIRSVRVTVGAETPDLLAEDTACYQGSVGSGVACASMEQSTSSVLFTATDLAPGEQMTVAVALNRDLIGVQIKERPFWMWLGVAAAIGWLLYVAGWVYWVRTKYKVAAPRVTQYEPYAAYPPMYTGVLYNGQLDERDITAGLIYLAQQGFLQITREESTTLWVFTNVDYTLELLRPIDEIPGQFLRSVANLVFGERPAVSDSVQLSSLQRSGRVRVNQRIIKSLKAAILEDLRDNGYLEQGSPVAWSTVLFVGALLGLGFGGFAILVPDGFLVLLFVVVGTVVLFGIAYADRYTKKGREAQHHLQGFRHFLAMTEARRYEFHNAPTRNTETFMQYLPYAIAFGVEQQWAEAFSDITIKPPEWYQAGAANGSFQVTELTTSLRSFSQSFSQASGSQGSSGGGSAGGGGGGGGGGSV